MASHDVWRQGDGDLYRTWGPSDHEFTFYVKLLTGVRRKFKVDAGYSACWRPMRNYRWDGESDVEVHNRLRCDVVA